MLAWIKYYMQAHTPIQAQMKLATLKKTAPQSAEYKQASNLLNLNLPRTKQQLNVARDLAQHRKLDQATQIYRELFQDELPQQPALEYWTILAYHLPTQHLALQHLKNIKGGKTVIQNIEIKPKTTIKIDTSQQQYWSLINQANIALKKQQLDASKHYFEQALYLNKKDTIAQQGLQAIQIQKQQNKLAILKQQEKLSKQPKDLIDIQTQIIQLDPQEVWYGYNLAMTYVNQHQFSKADQVFKLYAKNDKFWYIYALYLFNTQRLDQAQNSLSKVKQNPKARDLLSKITQIKTLENLLKQQETLKLQQNLDRLIAVQIKIIKLQPDQIWVVYNLAMSYIQQNRQIDADALFIHSPLKQKSDYNLAYAQYLFNTHRLDQAWSLIHKYPAPATEQLMVQIDQEKAYKDAQAFQNNHNYAAAENILQKVPKSVRRDLMLAYGYQQQNNQERAEHYYQEILTLEPQQLDALIGLAETSNNAKFYANQIVLDHLATQEQRYQVVQVFNKLGLKK